MVELEIFELSIFEEFPEIQKQFHGTQDEDKQEEIRMNLVKERDFISNIIRRYFRWEWISSGSHVQRHRNCISCRTSGGIVSDDAIVVDRDKTRVKLIDRL